MGRYAHADVGVGGRREFLGVVDVGAEPVPNLLGVAAVAQVEEADAADVGRVLPWVGWGGGSGMVMYERE